MRFVTAAMVALLAMAGSAAMAQQSDLPTRAGDKAIYFSIDGLGEFNVGQVNVDSPSLVSLASREVSFFRDNMAWRLGLVSGATRPRIPGQRRHHMLRHRSWL